ncbi:hypothetical protein GQR58_023429 [Nymphon striatum]|nr:hypothetical protein GQR58_023429 [Nymphon striatum]
MQPPPPPPPPSPPLTTSQIVHIIQKEARKKIVLATAPLFMGDQFLTYGQIHLRMFLPKEEKISEIIQGIQFDEEGRVLMEVPCGRGKVLLNLNCSIPGAGNFDEVVHLSSAQQGRCKKRLGITLKPEFIK